MNFYYIHIIFYNGMWLQKIYIYGTIKKIGSPDLCSLMHPGLQLI